MIFRKSSDPFSAPILERPERLGQGLGTELSMPSTFGSRPSLSRWQEDLKEAMAAKIAEVRASAERLRQATRQFDNQAALDDLAALASECDEPNWDGYGARPVSAKAVEFAKSFVRQLPFFISTPDVGAEPDGHVTLDWYRDPEHTISVSIDPEGSAHYAALIGPSRTYGTEPLSTDLPKVIYDSIMRVIFP